MATVLIIGASRGIGLETVRAALKAGYSVRALARSARRVPVDHPKLEKMAGDALETPPPQVAAEERCCRAGGASPTIDPLFRESYPENLRRKPTSRYGRNQMKTQTKTGLASILPSLWQQRQPARSKRRPHLRQRRMDRPLDSRQPKK